MRVLLYLQSFILSQEYHSTLLHPTAAVFSRKLRRYQLLEKLALILAMISDKFCKPVVVPLHTQCRFAIQTAGLERLPTRFDLAGALTVKTKLDIPLWGSNLKLGRWDLGPIHRLAGRKPGPSGLFLADNEARIVHVHRRDRATKCQPVDDCKLKDHDLELGWKTCKLGERCGCRFDRTFGRLRRS